MDESRLLLELGQASSSEAGVVFREHLRGCVRQMLIDVMSAEVTELCGWKPRRVTVIVFERAPVRAGYFTRGSVRRSFVLACVEHIPTARPRKSRWRAMNRRITQTSFAVRS